MSAKAGYGGDHDLVDPDDGRAGPPPPGAPRSLPSAALRALAESRHGDPFARNVTYNTRTSEFNVIDFEYATIVETGEGFTISDEDAQGPYAGSN